MFIDMLDILFTDKIHLNTSDIYIWYRDGDRFFRWDGSKFLNLVVTGLTTTYHTNISGSAKRPNPLHGSFHDHSWRKTILSLVFGLPGYKFKIYLEPKWPLLYFWRSTPRLIWVLCPMRWPFHHSVAPSHTSRRMGHVRGGLLDATISRAASRCPAAKPWKRSGPTIYNVSNIPVVIKRYSQYSPK